MTPGVSVSSGRGLKIALCAVLATVAMVSWSLSQVEWDPTFYTAFGEEADATRQYAEERLGEVHLRPLQGHDGKFFFVQANDPLILDPKVNASVLDRPLYRSQRMLYPLLAGGGGLFSPQIIVWALIAVNVLAMGGGTWATSVIARLMGMSPWWGLAFLLNVGFVSELDISGAGILGAALAFGAVAMIMQARTGWGIGLLAMAALSRESMLLAAAGVAWWLWRKRGLRSQALLAIIVPVAAAVSWALYLRLRIGLDLGAAQVEEIGLPFVGFFQALGGWRFDPLSLVLGLAIMTLFALFTKRVLVSDHLVGWAFIGFVALGVLFTEQVWRSYFDITRAIAPVITSYVLLLFAPVKEPARLA
jgi:hypothetical protein